MKKFQYKSVAAFTLAIFIVNILVAGLAAEACDLAALEAAKQNAWDAYKAASSAYTAHLAMEPIVIILGVLSQFPMAYVGGIWVYTAGGTALGILGPGSLVLAGAGAGAWIQWEGTRQFLMTQMHNRLAEYNQKRLDYEACANPPARYTYTCGYCNTVYEFSETTYGSASAAYTAYMNFIQVHVHSGW